MDNINPPRNPTEISGADISAARLVHVEVQIADPPQALHRFPTAQTGGLDAVPDLAGAGRRCHQVSIEIQRKSIEIHRNPEKIQRTSIEIHGKP